MTTANAFAPTLHVHVEAAQLRATRCAALTDDVVFRIEGRGALDCVQRIFTNDVVRCDPHALRWGAVLTPKGMILFDMWVQRDGDAAWLVVPQAAHDGAISLFARTVPPRLARVSEAGNLHATWLHNMTDGFRPDGPAPFTALQLGDPPAPVTAPPGFRDAVRLLEGWPVLGREIDDRTLPQEVRFDELAGVRYDKGCYTGQETVARLHFRGHANRTLRGLEWRGVPRHDVVTHGGRDVGRVTTWGIVGERVLGLSKIRREVVTGDTVIAGDVEATVVDLPFA